MNSKFYVFFNKFIFKGFLLEGDNLANQKEFIRVICMRFGSRVDVMEEFNNLV
jgi:hypothetical protein